MTTNTSRNRRQPSSNGTTTPLQDKVILLVLSLRSPGNARMIRDKSILTTDADKRRINAVKRLIDAPEHKAIAIHDAMVRAYIERIALPSPFTKGTHAIPVALLQEVEGTLEEHAKERSALVATLAKAYDRIKAESKVKLAGVFRESDYLAADQLDAAYRMTWQYISLDTPGTLQSIDGGLFRREQSRLREQWDEAGREFRAALRVGLSELVTDMVTRLQGVDDDRRFKPTALLQRFDDFLSMFKERNVTNDEQLEALAQQAQKVLKGVSTERLIESADLRNVVKKEFKKVQDSLAKLETEAAGRRRIRFTDE